MLYIRVQHSFTLCTLKILLILFKEHYKDYVQYSGRTLSAFWLEQLILKHQVIILGSVSFYVVCIFTVILYTNKTVCYIFFTVSLFFGFCSDSLESLEPIGQG